MEKITKNIICKNLQDTANLASKLAHLTLQGDIFLLRGDLGSGKTTFSKSFINSLNKKASVMSPSFPIILFYDIVLSNDSSCLVYHIDLYRVDKKSDLIELGIEEILYGGNVCLIEWFEKLQEMIPKDHVHINILFEYNNNNHERIFQITYQQNNSRFNAL